MATEAHPRHLAPLQPAGRVEDTVVVRVDGTTSAGRSATEPPPPSPRHHRGPLDTADGMAHAGGFSRHYDSDDDGSLRSFRSAGDGAAGAGPGGDAAGPTRPRPPIDVSRSRFPYAITWTPLPMITWLIPFIGHMGLCDSRGRVHDFAGPYTIGKDDMAFGAPTRYLVLDPKKVRVGGWDEGLAVADAEYSTRMHNICCDNCHSHVAYALNRMQYNGRRNWNMIILCFYVLFFGKWVSFGRFLKSWLPFCVILGGFLLLRYVAVAE